MFHVEHCTYNSGRVAGRQFIVAASASELEPPRSTVYKDLGSKMPAAVLPGVCHADCDVPSNGLQEIDFKAEVVELADTPS
jgi:hypothetical protein